MTTEGILWIVCFVLSIIIIALSIENVSLRKFNESLINRLELAQRFLRSDLKDRELL